MAATTATAAKKRSPHVSVFVASDNADVRPWFETNLPKGWKLIKPDQELSKPDMVFGLVNGEVRLQMG